MYHPIIAELLTRFRLAKAPAFHQLGVEDARALGNLSMQLQNEDDVPGVEYQDNIIDHQRMKIPVRRYWYNRTGTDPLVVFYHGGGWMFGNLDTHDSICRYISRHGNCQVIAVDYALAPENRFPVALKQCCAVVDWSIENAINLGVDTSRIAVAGDSAGGNLAAAVAHQRRNKNSNDLCFQALIYPAVDLGDNHRESWQKYAKGYLLTDDDVQWLCGLYLNHADEKKNPNASPLMASGFDNLPPALIITAEFDVIRDQGAAYARKLEMAGISVSYRCYTGMIHAFFGMRELGPTENGLDELCQHLRQAFKR